MNLLYMLKAREVLGIHLISLGGPGELVRTSSYVLKVGLGNYIYMSEINPERPNAHDRALTKTRETGNLQCRQIVAYAHICHGPHRLVLRTSRCGRDNPGSTPGVDILRVTLFHEARTRSD